MVLFYSVFPFLLIYFSFQLYILFFININFFSTWNCLESNFFVCIMERSMVAVSKLRIPTVAVDRM